MALPILKTPAEFIDFYFTELKTQLGSNNFKLNKTGFIGFILNVLGNTQFDVKQYYDGLFNEAFPSTAIDNLNLQFHSALHNYQASFATPSTVVDGSFKFDLALLPTPQSGLMSRNITFGSSTSVIGSTLPIGIDSNSTIYSLNSLYNIDARIVNGVIVSYDAQIIEPGAQKTVSMTLDLATLPIIAATQSTTTESTYTVPYYTPGTHYLLSIPLVINDMISGLTVSVLNSNTNVSTQYTISNDKSIYGPTSTVIFETLGPNNTLNLELGSGVNGAYIPSGSILTILLQTSKGSAGNITPSNNITSKITPLTGYTQSAIITDTYSTGVISSIIDLSKFATPTINTSTGGADVLTGGTLRQALIKYIQSNDYLITDLDYNNYLSASFKDHYVSFGKVLLASNTMYLYIPLTNKYDLPYSVSTMPIEATIFETTKYTDTLGNSVVYHPTATLNGSNVISPFYYKYDTLFRSYRGYSLNDNSLFYYTTVNSKDVNNIQVTNKVPYVSVRLTYHHNTIAPFTIISLESFEDISSYTIAPAFASVSVASPSVSMVTNTSTHIIPTVRKSGITTTTSIVIAISDTFISAIDVSLFPLSGTLLIDTEEILYTGRDLIANTFTGLTRGANGTVVSAHIISSVIDDLTLSNASIDFIFGVIATTLTANVAVADTTITVSDTTYFPASGIIGIGTEQMSYGGKTATTLTGIVRGINTTVITTHVIGDSVFEATTSTAAIASPELYLGVIPAITQLVVTLDNTNISGGLNSTYDFSAYQLINISDYLFIKDFNTVGSTPITITSAISSIDTVFNISSTSLFLSTGGYGKIGTEIIYYTGKTPTSLTGITRGLRGTTASSYSTIEVIYTLGVNELSVPVIDSTQYTADSVFIQTQITNKLSTLTIPTQRSLSDETQVRFLNTNSISLADIKAIVYNGSSYISNIILPLKVSIYLLLSNQLITSNSANVANDISTLKLTIAQALVNSYSGVKIRVSDADLVLICKAIAYVDDANITFTDSSATPVQIPNNEINVKPDIDILSGMVKAQRLNYVPPLWNWDINNISVTYTIQ